MPGSSLWLIPPPDSQFSRSIQTIISGTVPFRFAHLRNLYKFLPHVTITSNIPPHLHEPDAQAWLDSLDLTPSSEDDFVVSADSELAEEATRAPPTNTIETSHPPDATLTTVNDEKSTTTTAPASPPRTAAGPPPDLEVNLTTLEAGVPFFRKLTLKASKPCPGLSELTVALRAQCVYNGAVDTARHWEEDEFRPHLSLMYADISKAETTSKLPAVLQDIERARAILKPAKDGTVAKGGLIVLVPTDRKIEEWKPIASRAVQDCVWKWTSSA